MTDELTIKLSGVMDRTMAQDILNELKQFSGFSTRRVIFDCAGIERCIYEALEFLLSELKQYNRNHKTSMQIILLTIPASMARQCQLLGYKVCEKSLILKP